MHMVALAALAVACLAESGMAANCAAPKVGQKQNLSPADIATILERHNYERDLLTSQGYADIHYMKWSNELQQLAENLAGSCVFQHSSSACRQGLPIAPYVGENLAAVSIGSSLNSDIYKMCTNWDKEKKDYHPTTGKCNNGKVCGHYTQVIWPATQFVGCAVTKCQSGILSMPSYDIRCVYAPGGNFNGELATHPASGACLTKNKCGTSHEGACILSGNGYSCECHPGYTNQGNNPKNKCVKGSGSGNGNTPPPPSKPITCNAATTCNGRGVCVNNKCKCNAGWNGASCSLKDDLCNGYCKHATGCTVTNNVPKCKSCDAGWTGQRCDAPAGGSWNPTGMWVDVTNEVTKRRRNYGRNAIPLRSLDRSTAVKEANKCDNRYHPDTEVTAAGVHEWGMMICVDKPESQFPYGSWLGKDVIAKMAKFAMSPWTTGYGCALSANSCSGKPGYCSGKPYRMLICGYELKVGHNIPEKFDRVLEDEATPPEPAAAGSIAVPILAAACVVLAALVVVLAIKVRRNQQVEQAEGAYNELNTA